MLDAGPRESGSGFDYSVSTSRSADPQVTTIGAHEFRNRFGWYMERAAAGEELIVTHRGKPRLRLELAA